MNRRVKCAGCDSLVYDFADYGEFVLCESCEAEMIEVAERQMEAEEEAFVTRYCYEGE